MPKVFKLPDEGQYLVIAGDWKLPSKEFMNMSDPPSRDEATNMLRARSAEADPDTP